MEHTVTHTFCVSFDVTIVHVNYKQTNDLWDAHKLDFHTSSCRSFNESWYWIWIRALLLDRSLHLVTTWHADLWRCFIMGESWIFFENCHNTPKRRTRFPKCERLFCLEVKCLKRSNKNDIPHPIKRVGPVFDGLAKFLMHWGSTIGKTSMVYVNAL